MTTYHIYGPSKGKWTVNLGPSIAQGAAGTIHRVVGQSGVVVKLYKDPKDRAAYNEKIEAMLAARPNLPPFSYNGRTCIQIAWPLGKVCDGRGDFLGFVMPEVDIQASTELENVLQKAMRTRKGISEFYGTRVLLAANLAALMAELHALGHHMIDMKPINMRFYPHAWYMAILDTDGFSINGQRRLPAHQYSDEYIAPEARGKSPESLGLEQDLFALATIIFRLMNNGLHPYQGIDTGNQPTTLQERIFAGLYAYGVNSHRAVKPAPSSIHQYLEDDTRALFDRAFQIKGSRPTSAEWRDHINGLIKNKVLVKCAKDSQNHAHFSKGCGLCAVAAASAPRQLIQSPANVLHTLPIGTFGTVPPSGQATYAGHQVAAPATSVGVNSRTSLLAGLGVCALALGLYIFWPQQQRTASSSSPPLVGSLGTRTTQSPSAFVTPDEAVPLLQVSYGGSQIATARWRNLSLVIDSMTSPDGFGHVPFVTIYNGNRPAFSFHMDQGGTTSAANLRFLWLDATTKIPQIVLTSYSGGAHCCILTKIAIVDPSGVWHEVDGGALDGDAGYQFIDLNHDGSIELISLDNSFLYAFGCYTCSSAPTRIKRLIGTELKDITREPEYPSYLRERLRQMEAYARTNPNALHSNGYLGGWVAAKALVGELIDAWRTMLANYDRQSTWIMEECLTGEPLQKCPHDKKHKLEFPEALAKHLFKNNYVTAEQEEQLIALSPGDAATATPPATSREAMIARERACAADWKADKAAGKIAEGMKWPQYWNDCNTRKKAEGL